MPSGSLTPTSIETDPPLPRPTVVGGSRPSSRASSRTRSAYSSAAQSRSSSPAQPPYGVGRNGSAGTPSGSSLRPARSTSRSASTSSSIARNRQRTIEPANTRNATNPSNVVEISSDSSDDDEVVAVGLSPILRTRSSDFEVAGIRRAPAAPPTIRSDLFSPPPPLGRPAGPLRFDSNNDGRMIGVSIDPSTGNFLTRPMPIVRPRSSSSLSDADGSFSIISAQTAPQLPPRSEHPITDQRLRSTNLAMPTKSPPRSKPPPIEHHLLSKFTCPICFDAPTNLCVTPCGHFFCGECLFQALKTQAVQRGAAEEEQSLFGFEGLLSRFAPGAAFGAGRGAGAASGAGEPESGGGGGSGGGGRGGGAAAGRGRGGGGASRGGSAAGVRGGGARSRPDPLAGQCPVCRSKIKGAFNGREKNGIVGLRLTTGKPVNDPREEDGKMKTGPIKQDASSVDSSDSGEDEPVLPTSVPLFRKGSSDEQTQAEEGAGEEDGQGKEATNTSQKGLRRRRRNSSNTTGTCRRSPRTQRGTL
ncbi:uncharacterized protein UHOD_00799 [Ustilago sp. UG-2017b]|nr:uncharacterized protein UHOD_00799 [Ustilago sp. UG-2017b]